MSVLTRDRARCIAILLAGAGLAAGCFGRDGSRPAEGSRAGGGHGPLSPAAALASFSIEPGYRIELVAAEPLVVDPVAIAFDERARMYVAENRGYPDIPERAGDAPAEGVIGLLEDTDGDGRFDRRVEFATGIPYPNGVLPWNGGVFVSSAPDLLYFRDTDGDGRADERRVVLTGFGSDRTAQIRFSHPTLGLDNRVYLTSGLNGGRVTSPDHPERPAVEFETPSDSRFDPVTLRFELTGGQGQYGLTFDDFGRRFICANRNPVRHVVLEPWYLRRHPHLAFSATFQEVSPAGAEARVWPISADTTTASFMPGLMSTPHAGTFTAASGVHFHRGDALPEGHQGSIFVCESAQNLVQRQVRSAEGVTFTSRPAREGVEFLASTDRWFRPVFAANGPDGALYIVDMYRLYIDHPHYVPEETRARLDFQAGKEHGRIYRVLDGRRRAPVRVALDSADVEELCGTLEHPNAWRRETAQRLLVERRAAAAIPCLRRMAADGRRDVARVHALWTLHGLDALDDELVAGALRDPHAGVRENAVLLAETRIVRSPALLAPVVALAEDPDARVRFRVALALGEVGDPSGVAALAGIARRDGGDRWVRAAVLSSIDRREQAFLRAFVAARTSDGEAREAVMQDLARLICAARTAEQCLGLLAQMDAAVAGGEEGLAVLLGIAEGLQMRAREGAGTALTAVLDGTSSVAPRARARVRTLLERASRQAADGRAPVERRLTAIALLGYTTHEGSGTTLRGLLEPQHPPEIQIAAVRALGRLPGPQGGRALVEPQRWRSFSPRVREAVLTVLTGEDRLVAVLLDALENGRIPSEAVGPLRRSRLRNHRDPAIRARAGRLFASLDAGDRMRVYETYRDRVLALSGDPAAGRGVFATHCASCHAFAGTGGRLGPDLSGLRNQPAEAILLHVLVPDYEIAPGYAAYAVTTRDRRTVFGLLESEAPNSLTLRDASSRQHTLLRTEIASMKAVATSLMPAGMEMDLQPQALADLLAYLKSGSDPKQAPAGR